MMRPQSNRLRGVFFALVILVSWASFALVSYGCNVEPPPGGAPCVICVAGNGGCQGVSFGYYGCLEDVDTGFCFNAGNICP